MELFYKTITEIFRVIAVSPVLNFVCGDNIEITLNDGRPLFKCGNSLFLTPIPRINTIYNNKSPLPNDVIDFVKMSQLVVALSKRDSIIRLNHIGICYKTDSQKDERTKLNHESRIVNLNLYEEPSSDQGLWLFLGDIIKWDDPLLELLPVQDASDNHVDYWLPHFQFDIDTKLTIKEIEGIVHEVYRDKITPYRLTIIDGVVYNIRLRLGIVSGININLDIAANSRQVEFFRKHSMIKLQ